MPIVGIKVLESVFDRESKKAFVDAATDAVGEVGGEGLRPATQIVLEEVGSGLWSSDGTRLTTEATLERRAKRAGGKPGTPQDRGLAGNGNGRQALIRYTHSFGGGTALLLAVENPETNRAIVSGAYTAPVVISAGGAPDRIPDLVAVLRHKWSNGRVKFGAVFGEEGISDGAGSSGSTLVWAVQGALRIKFNNKRTQIALLGFFGEGMGKYWRGMPGSIAITGTNGRNVDVKAIRHYGGYA